MSAKRYLLVLGLVAGAVLALILCLNLQLGERALGGPEATRLASEWQQDTRGVTYAPPTTRTRPFKSLRLADRIGDINAIVLGSSTGMGIRGELLPPELRLYNFTLTGNLTSNIVSEAEYLMQHHADRVRFLLVGLDWSIGMIFHKFPPPAMDLTPAAALSGAAHPPVSLDRKVVDALSYPKVENLVKALRAIVRDPDPVASFRHTFFDIASAPYQCEDGTPARDFDVINRGKCIGFRYDGSWTFGGEQRLSPARAAMLARAAAAPSSKFSRFLCESGGVPNAEYLDRLAAVARKVGDNGGTTLFVLPPMIPGMEGAMAETPDNRRCLEQAKSALQAWAVRHGLTVVDAGQSERYGCTPGEFLDEHHAFPECHRKVLDFYFKAAGAKQLRPGLMQP